MQSSASSNLPKAKLPPNNPAWIVWAVWLLRICVGSFFILSGFSKTVDPWGSLYKIQEYLAVWGLDVPRSVVLSGGVLLSIFEATGGAMLLLGCYRRSAVVLLIVIMSFMLPLSVWLAAANPIDNCGCFGDLWTISNTGTLVKNIIVTALLVPMWWLNRRVRGLISPAIQWVAGSAIVVYLIFVSLIGYNVQPLIDFRAWPVGESLIEKDSETVPEFEFIYEKEGRRKVFNADNLPDSTWTFVDRKAIGEETAADDSFIVYDKGEDVTEEAIPEEGQRLLVLVPDIGQTDISFTYYLNAIQRYMQQRGDGTVVAVLAADENDIDRWRDLSNATYPVYSADASQIKTLARGHMALVYVDDGIVKWKQSASSVDGEQMLKDINKGGFDYIVLDDDHLLGLLTWGLAVILFFIIFANAITRFARSVYMRRRHYTVPFKNRDS